VRGARADLFPTVTGSVSATRSRRSASASAAAAGGASRTAADYQIGVDVAYEADLWGGIRRNVQGAVASAQASAADLETVRLSVHAELALDYFQLRGLDAERRLLDRAVAAYEKALQLTTNRHDQGVASGLDVAQAQTQLYTTRAQATDLALARAQLEHAIAILSGKPPSGLAIAPLERPYAPPAVPVALPSELLERRPDIASFERRMAAANAQVGVAQAALFPNLFLSASGGFDSAKIAGWLSPQGAVWSIGSSLVATLVDGGKRRATRDQARAFYDASVAGYRETVLTAFQEVEDNLAALRILDEEARQQADAVAAAERSLDLARTRYQAGVTSYLEVTVAQSAALADQRVAVDLLTRRMTASVSLAKALGGGWRASDLPSGAGMTRGASLRP
jgi:NodT family efflux transporter outer membrane factor (OMF) lipoprotein